MGRDISELHPELQEKIKKLIKVCKADGLNVKITECFRSVSEQNEKYAQGRTAPGNIVTNTKGTGYSSMHQWGVAFDICRNQKTNFYDNSDGFFEKVAKHARVLGLIWGGDWKSYCDKPHFQLSEWGDRAVELKRLYGNPDNFMKTWAKSSNNKPTKMPTKKSTKKITYSKLSFVRDIQKDFGVIVDGKAGKDTLNASITVSAKTNSKHPCVKHVQKYFKSIGYTEIGDIDGIAGDLFTEVVKKYQKTNGISADGIISAKKNTWKLLLGIR